MKALTERFPAPATRRPGSRRLTLTAIILLAAAFLIPACSSFAQRSTGVEDAREAEDRLQHQGQLEQIKTGKEAYVAAIVARWEETAKGSGRWDEHYATDLGGALMKLNPESLIVVGNAASYADMMNALATGRQAKSIEPGAGLQEALGDATDDLVYTPIPTCRIVDTRVAGGPIPANGTRAFDVDGTTFVGQGGVNTSCGIPFGVARAVVMTIRSYQPAAMGFFKAWAVGAPQPNGGVLNFNPGQLVANTTVVNVLPGTGTDFQVLSSATSHVYIDVLGYFAAPVSTALACTTVDSGIATIANNVWTPVDAACPAGTSATGGGYDVPEQGTLGYPGMWVTSLPSPAVNGWRIWVDNQTGSNRTIHSYARCCRIPGR